ncbi:MAG: DUF2059 domain-containing protein [Gammaproteobacteria bacterium]
MQRKIIYVFAISWAALMALTSQVAAQDDEVSAEHEAAIRLLIEETGALDMGEQFADLFVTQMSQGLRQARPDIPPRAFVIIREETMATLQEELESGSMEDLVVPIYAKYFTLEEVQELLAFYRTPIGRKTVEVMPVLTQESMQVGQSWGMAIGPVIGQRVAERLAEEGIEVGQ